MNTAPQANTLPSGMKLTVGVLGAIVLLIAGMDIAQAIQPHPLPSMSLKTMQASIPAKVPDPDAFNEQRVILAS